MRELHNNLSRIDRNETFISAVKMLESSKLPSIVRYLTGLPIDWMFSVFFLNFDLFSQCGSIMEAMARGVVDDQVEEFLIASRRNTFNSIKIAGYDTQRRKPICRRIHTFIWHDARLCNSTYFFLFLFLLCSRWGNEWMTKDNNGQ